MFDTTEAAVPENSEQQEENAPFSPGEKKDRFWSFLQRQRVGNELVFTVSLAEKAKSDVPAAKNYCYEMLKNFEAAGRIRRKHLERGQGTLITFLPKEGRESASTKKTSRKTKFSETTTFSEAIALLNEEIRLLEDRIEGKKALRDQLVAMIGKEK